MRAATLFSGIGAPEQARPDWHWLWHAEIEPFPAAVMAARHPGSINLGDVLADDFAERAAKFGHLDVIVAGWPCQDLSVAGQRAGLAGKRSGLFFRMMEIIDHLKPNHLLLENVPGLISMNGGSDLAECLDTIEKAGYITDIDILDAQFFGVPQRRQRVFICGEKASALISKKTLSSALSIAQCLTELSVLILAALNARFRIDLNSLAFDAGKPSHSLQKRIQLFGLASDRTASMLQENLAVLQAASVLGHAGLAWDINGSEITKTSTATRLRGSSAEMERWRAECLCIAPSWNGFLGDISRIARKCITSTDSSETIEKIIYSSARALLHIVGHITPSMACSPAYWSAVSSASTALEAFTNYARQASSDLFTELGWIRPWHDFLRQAELANISFRHIGNRDTSQVLPFGTGMRGYPEKGEEKREDLAGTLGQGAGSGGGRTTDLDSCCAYTVHAAFSSAMTSQTNGNAAFEADRARCLDSSGGFAANQGGTVVVQAFHGRQEVRRLTVEECETFVAAYRTSGNCGAWDTGDRVDALTTATDPNSHIVALQARFRGDDGRGYSRPPPVTEDVIGTLETVKPWNVATGMQVRRLTPRECERLQGFPDDFTLIDWRDKPAADGPRYRAIGNSMAVPVLRWLLSRIEAQHTVVVEEQAA